MFLISPSFLPSGPFSLSSRSPRQHRKKLTEEEEKEGEANECFGNFYDGSSVNMECKCLLS